MIRYLVSYTLWLDGGRTAFTESFPFVSLEVANMMASKLIDAGKVNVCIEHL